MNGDIKGGLVALCLGLGVGLVGLVSRGGGETTSGEIAGAMAGFGLLVGLLGLFLLVRGFAER